MASLEIPVTTVADLGLHVDVAVAPDALRPADAPSLPLKEVSVRGDLTSLVGQFLFQGTVEAVFVHPCDRCLEEAEFPVSAPVVWTFEEGSTEGSAAGNAELEEEEAHGVFAFDGQVIDLARPAWDEVNLALPAKFLCREDCRGLCPVCGADRNTAPCSCTNDETEETPASNSGFAGLKDMFPDLPEQR